jgi:hypothetical protein
VGGGYSPRGGPSVGSARDVGHARYQTVRTPYRACISCGWVVRGVSPLIWRRLLIPADTPIAGLHGGVA